tara:strand:+ start:6692 stop:7381 length:690 start_codon:yes stop_codon:yes gene_type:complete
MVKILELFSGTGSVGKVCKQLGWETLSVDIDGRADINCDILSWDYKQYPKDSFDAIWASPPCASFSVLQYSWIGRNRDGKIFTREDIETNMTNVGDPLAKRTLEIINYFKPELWFMENPNTGNLKNREYMIDLPCYIVDYCMYSDWGYRKRTRIWTNKKDWKPLTCDNKGTCGNMIGSLHKTNLGNTERLLKAEKRLKHKEDVSGLKKRTSLDDRYRIPEDLIFSLFLD